MAHIALPEGAPGISGPMRAYPETGERLEGLAEALLRGPSSLSQAEREMIAAFVSSRNECFFCTSSHAAVARYLMGGECEVVDEVLENYQDAAISEKMKALLAIAGKVREDGRLVEESDIARARAAGADDKAIHDTVLVAAAFCMFNRYVDGLATWAPEDPKLYEDVAVRLATEGYERSKRQAG